MKFIREIPLNTPQMGRLFKVESSNFWGIARVREIELYSIRTDIVKVEKGNLRVGAKNISCPINRYQFNERFT